MRAHLNWRHVYVHLSEKFVVNAVSVTLSCYPGYLSEQDCLPEARFQAKSGTFSRIRKIAKKKTAISFVISVYLSVRLFVSPRRWNNSAPTGRIFMKFECFLENVSRRFKFYEIWQITGTLHEGLCMFLAVIFVHWEMFRTKVVEKIKTLILVSITFFPPRKSCRLWDSVWNSDRGRQTTDNNMEHALCMLVNGSYQHTLRIYNTYCSSTATVVSRRRLEITLYFDFFWPCIVV
jgi:hypothetical protein